jgi:hypothetical protein
LRLQTYFEEWEVKRAVGNFKYKFRDVYSLPSISQYLKFAQINAGEMGGTFTVHDGKRSTQV